jgi:hypothetical protein
MGMRSLAPIAVGLWIVAGAILPESSQSAERLRESAPATGGIVLAGETVRFDARLEPQFTANQIRGTADATRAGLARWAATPHGRKLITWFINNECLITATEDSSDEGVGKAPQPGLATLIAASDHSHLKFYALSLNPLSFVLPEGMQPLPNQPATPADLMAAAWAAEMLHIAFYARGVSLPHHSRGDFQDEWRAIAEELGFPGMLHDDGAEEERQARRRLIRIGYGPH